VIKRLSALSQKLAATLAVSALGLVLSPSSARADVVFYEKDGWGVYTRGLIASHYQLASGDPDPATSHGVLVGGKLMTTSVDDACNSMEPAPTPTNPAMTRCKASLSLSRIRSGFIGTQLGVGVRRTITPDVKVDSLVAINLADVSSSRNQEINKGVDVREAWASLSGSFGAFKFGRHFLIFGSGSAPVVLISHKYSLGHPCFVDFTTIACGPVGAGPIYADFDAQLRYETPRFVGLQFQVAASDPWVGPGFDITPLPRFDAELNFDQSFGEGIRARVFLEGTYQQLKRRASGPTNALKEATLMGGFGSAIVDIMGFAIGGGGWQCKGCGTRQVAELGIDTANPLFFDNQAFDLRTSRGFFGNAGYTIAGFTLAAGGGAAYVQPTTADAPELMGLPQSTLVSVLHSSTEFHVTAAYQWDAVAFGIEYMRWANKWHYGEKQDVNFAGGGANFIW
jgi:predicted porin